MYLDDIVAAQKHGEPKGVTSICSAHPWVLKAAMGQKAGILLIESTCNQVNQYGGYTGMNPAEFVCYLRRDRRGKQFSIWKYHPGWRPSGPGRLAE